MRQENGSVFMSFLFRKNFEKKIQKKILLRAYELIFHIWPYDVIRNYDVVLTFFTFTIFQVPDFTTWKIVQEKFQEKQKKPHYPNIIIFYRFLTRHKNEILKDFFTDMLFKYSFEFFFVVSVKFFTCFYVFLREEDEMMLFWN